MIHKETPSIRTRPWLTGDVGYREHVTSFDVDAVGYLVESAGVFSESEKKLAVELVKERLEKGIESGYLFLFGETAGGLLGYACFGPIPCTADSYDLYWIVVSDACKGSGLAERLLEKTEGIISAEGGGKVYVETSMRDEYARSRRFYSKNGYRMEAVLEDFYAPDDHKAIFVKNIGQR